MIRNARLISVRPLLASSYFCIYFAMSLDQSTFSEYLISNFQDKNYFIVVVVVGPDHSAERDRAIDGSIGFFIFKRAFLPSWL